MTEPVPNEALREHVTSTGFALTLGKTHVAKLIWIDQSLKAKRHLRTHGYVMQQFIVGSRGLLERGLIEHTAPTQETPRKNNEVPVSRIWKITKAGRLVINLLKESGLYEEYLPFLELEESA